ncbi:Dirigent protein [Rhynchospora pubera]|uniref:Dirigent protein n=1 Tax=Rhynchospora pubera TaxID=906938 RepID=A0AAV8H4C3_9POAL|nr:Dirigent protein [Rhynchospora pubera]
MSTHTLINDTFILLRKCSSVITKRANFTRPSFLLFFLSTFIIQLSSSHAPIHLRFYFHEKYRGENATSNVVATLNRPNSTFGNIVVFDNPLRAGPESNSKLIGRAQGTAFRSSFSEESALAAITLLFSEGEFNGSSISLIGLVDGSGSADRTVVGGSGHFRMAKGYVLTKIVNSTAVSLMAQYDAYIWS